MSVAEVTSVGGFSANAIARWETGDYLPSLDNALKLAKVLDTTVEKLWPTLG